MDYREFLDRKRRKVEPGGIEPGVLPSQLYEWQAAIVRWALRRGRAAIWADCGLGKTFMQVAWAHALPGRILIVAPLCVAEQTTDEASRLGISVRYVRTQAEIAPTDKLVITNYERIDAFDFQSFSGVVLDESSILKSLDGKTREKLTQLSAGIPFRLCCTATPSPNDIAELANHAEFLGLMTRQEFLATWFVKVQEGHRGAEQSGWRLKGHAHVPFYKWLASWAVALRRPSDLGYSDSGFNLPPLEIVDHVLEVENSDPSTLLPGMSVKGLSGRLTARRASLEARVNATADLVMSNGDQWIVWCGLNPEAEAVTRAVPGAVNVTGSDSYEQKRAAVLAFLKGDIRVLVSKVQILGYGLNFQHCHQAVFVGIGDSYEQYYQAIRRNWRFGQKHPVTAHIVVSEAELAVVANVRRKEAAASALVENMLAHTSHFNRKELAS